MREIHLAHSPFKVAKDNIDFTQYKDEIEVFIERYILPLKQLFPWINEESFKNYFWKLTEEVDKIHPNRWEVNLSYLLGRILVLKALLNQNRIIQQLYDLNVQLFDYLVKRFTPHILNISSDFLGKIYGGVPVMESPPAKSLLKRMTKVYGSNNLIEVLQNQELDITDKIRAFDENYRLHYSYFLTRCEHIGDQLNILENSNNLKNWGNNLYNIFFLGRNHAKTPPKLVDQTFIELIHVRNALSHIESGGIHEIDNSHVKIIDKDKSGKISFERIIEVEDLWKFYYDLISIDRILDMFALFLQVVVQLKHENDNNVVYFVCSCGNTANIYIPPDQNELYCKNCFRKHEVSKFKKYRIGI